MSDPIDTLNASDDVKARLRSLRDEVEAAIPYETLALRAEVASLTATLTAERQRAERACRGLIHLQSAYDAAVAARRASTPTRESRDRIDRTAGYLFDVVGEWLATQPTFPALTSPAAPARVAEVEPKRPEPLWRCICGAPMVLGGEACRACHGADR